MQTGAGKSVGLRAELCVVISLAFACSLFCPVIKALIYTRNVRVGLLPGVHVTSLGQQAAGPFCHHFLGKSLTDTLHLRNVC